MKEHEIFTEHELEIMARRDDGKPIDTHALLNFFNDRINTLQRSLHDIEQEMLDRLEKLEDRLSMPLPKQKK